MRPNEQEGMNMKTMVPFYDSGGGGRRKGYAGQRRSFHGASHRSAKERADRGYPRYSAKYGVVVT